MCDQDSISDNAAFLQRSGRLSRRRFTALTAAAAAGFALPRAANAETVVETDVLVTTPDGSADGYFVHPVAGRHPGVIVWPDILGLRPAFRLMGKRLAEAGYAVLVVNPYYRRMKAPVVAEGATFQDPAVREFLMPLATSLTPATQATDARAYVAFLDRQTAVDTGRGIGTAGYCMGGPIVMRTAATVPERIGAAASFHGARLVTDTPDSPHRLIPQMRASFLIAIAENDDEREPEAKTVLRQAFDAAGLPAEIEVYAGALHGWCPPDSAVYDELQAERAWARMLALFEKVLVSHD
jgi:carboxymethylenebutenolidase